MNYFEYRDAVYASDMDYKAKAVCLAIASHYNWKTDEACWPSDALLAKETGLSESSVKRGKRDATAAGYLGSQRRFNATNLYIPTLSEVTQTPPEVTLTSQTGHSDPTLRSHRPTNSEKNNEENSEVNNEEREEVVAPPAAGVESSSLTSSFDTSLADIEASFSKIVNEEGELLEVESMNHLDYLDWGIDSVEPSLATTNSLSADTLAMMERDRDRLKAAAFGQFARDEWDRAYEFALNPDWRPEVTEGRVNKAWYSMPEAVRV